MIEKWPALLKQLIPFYNRRGRYSDRIFEESPCRPRTILWGRYATTSACMYPDFCEDRERMCRVVREFDLEELNRIRSIDLFYDFLASIERMLTSQLDEAIADAGLRAVDQRDGPILCGSEYPACESGGRI